MACAAWVWAGPSCEAPRPHSAHLLAVFAQRASHRVTVKGERREDVDRVGAQLAVGAAVDDRVHRLLAPVVQVRA
jgi:hypothetical protein